MKATLPALAGASVLSAYAVLQVLGRTSGSTPAERRSVLPGDALVPDAQIVTDHAVTVAAPPDQVWPWLTQMGWHLGGYYTPRWVDRLLFPDNWPSLDRLDPLLVRDLRAGDAIPDGPPGTAAYRVVEADAPHVLLLHSTTHVPPGWGESRGARISWTWCFLLTATAGGTRLHTRVRGHMDPWWFAALYLATIVPADHVMATGMLRGIRTRVEATACPARPRQPGPTSPVPRG
jgi:hypothetical protein